MALHTLTRTERQARRAHWHGATIAIWGAWVLLFGARNFESNDYRFFTTLNLGHWAWGLIGIVAGGAIYYLATHPWAVEHRVPGKIAMAFWLITGGYFLFGNFRMQDVPLYGMLAVNAFRFLVRE